MLDHKHIIVSAFGLASPPRTAEAVATWLGELVDLVGMKVLMGPYATRCDDVGNEGVTGIVCISTSHSSVHCWDMVAEPFLKMDLYSCKDFSVETVVNHLTQFGPSSVDYVVLDRNGQHTVIIECADEF